MNNDISTTCCIAGGGPAGMMLGFLLARAGVEVIVLEKHADFFRDFRGDTIHPSTFNIMDELGLLNDFLKVPHEERQEVSATIGGKEFPIGDFSRLPVAHQYLGFMPQWDFLEFLLSKATAYPTFRLMKSTEAIAVNKSGGKVTGLRAGSAAGEFNINALLTVAADGRTSTMAASAGLKPIQTGSAIDVLWFRLSRQKTDPKQTLLSLNADNVFIAIERDTYYQCGYIIAKGSYERIKSEGLDSFKEKMVSVMPFAKDRMPELKTWDDIRLLDVAVSHLPKWYTDGFLCIGDSAHAMSPVGGVGINLAIQDAVAAANMLYEPLRKGAVSGKDLDNVQRRRSFPARVIQTLQITLERKVVIPTIMGKNKAMKPPLFIRMLRHFPLLRRLLGRAIGLGLRPEHIRTPIA